MGLHPLLWVELLVQFGVLAENCVVACPKKAPSSPRLMVSSPRLEAPSPKQDVVLLQKLPTKRAAERMFWMFKADQPH